MVAPRVCYTVTLIHSDSYILIAVKIMKGEKCLRIQKPFTYQAVQFLLPEHEQTFLVFHAVPLPTITYNKEHSRNTLNNKDFQNYSYVESITFTTTLYILTGHSETKTTPVI